MTLALVFLTGAGWVGSVIFAVAWFREHDEHEQTAVRLQRYERSDR